MSKYLDTSGLTYFWEKIKTYVDSKISSVSAGVISFKSRSGAVEPQSGDYTADMVGADASGTAASAVSAHNASSSAHSDIRTALDSKETSGTAASKVSAHNSDTAAHSDIRNALAEKETAGAASAVQANLDTHEADTTAHVTASERAAWNAKQTAITGGASTIATSNLTANRALISNSSGKVAASDITSTELGYLDGATSNIQTQLDGKEASGAASAVQANLDAHTGDSDIHVTASEKATWNAKETAGAASSAVSAHNSDSAAHSDIRNAIPKNTSQLTNDSGYITIDDVPEGSTASTTTPKMNGTAATGSETAFARGDHVHPIDTSRAAASDLTSHTDDADIHVTADEKTAWNGKATVTSKTVTLSTSSWKSGTYGKYSYYYYVSFSGVTSTSNIIVSPVPYGDSGVSVQAWRDCDIAAFSQGSNYLYIGAVTQPTVTVKVNILVIN